MNYNSLVLQRYHSNKRYRATPYCYRNDAFANNLLVVADALFYCELNPGRSEGDLLWRKRGQLF